MTKREELKKQRGFKLLYKVYRKLPENLKLRIYKFIRINILKDSKKLTPNKIFKVKVKRGKNFKLKHAGGIIENEIFIHGLFKTWESELGWLWIELCEFNNIIFDIGANKGIYTLVAKSINPDSKVYAFEPSINTFEKLLFNIDLNNYKVTCEKLAVSNQTGKQLYFDIPNENQTTASLSPDKMKNWAGYQGEILEYQVETIRLEDYVKRKKINKIDLIKIDIEMHEPEAFEGMGKILTEFKPIVVFEMLNEKVASSLKNIIDLEHYMLFHLKKDRTVKRMDTVEIALNSINNEEWNYIIVPKELNEVIDRKTSLLQTVKN